MSRALLGIVFAVALVLGSAASALASDDNAACVGQFSRFFAQGGGGTHRSELARDFAVNAHPAGLNVYSHYARLHGSLDDCFAQ